MGQTSVQQRYDMARPSKPINFVNEINEIITCTPREFTDKHSLSVSNAKILYTKKGLKIDGHIWRAHHSPELNKVKMCSSTKGMYNLYEIYYLQALKGNTCNLPADELAEILTTYEKTFYMMCDTRQTNAYEIVAGRASNVVVNSHWSLYGSSPHSGRLTNLGPKDTIYELTTWATNFHNPEPQPVYQADELTVDMVEGNLEPLKPSKWALLRPYGRM